MKKQIHSVLQDSEIVAEVRERTSEGRTLPKAPRFDIQPAVIRATLGSAEMPEAQRFADRPLTEAIILEFGRPALLVRGDSFDVPAADTWKSRLYPTKSRIERALRSVGRVEVFGHPTFDWIGTGWVIAEKVIVTNRHVALEFGKRKGQAFVFQDGVDGGLMEVRVDFKEEYRGTTPRELQVKRIRFIEQANDQSPDVAFVELESSGSNPAPIELLREKFDPGRYCAVVGYPARDSRNGADAMQRVFGDIYDVKRLAPGTVTKYDNNSFTFEHDCSTLGGNSGSVIVDVETGGALGLHFGGLFRRSNYAVKAQKLLDLLTKQKITITVPASPAAPAKAPAPAKTPATSTTSKPDGLIRPMDYLKDREGYQEGFLGSSFKVPLPKVTGTSKLLRYMHFSVSMNPDAERRIAHYTAVNIDGRDLRRIPRATDKWFLDPRLELSAQAGESLYSKNDLDRGHLVRRLDPVWGPDAETANEDTFHFPNCSPQHKDFNQRTWNDLEDYVLDNAGAHLLKVNVFTGPVFGNNDRLYRKVRLPQEFWKVVVIVKADTGKLSTTGYILTQADMIAGDLEFVYGRFRTYQVPVAMIESKTKLDFGKTADADPLKGTDVHETRAAFRQVEGPADIVF